MEYKTVKELKKYLETMPENAFVYAYEGEKTGIVFISQKVYTYKGGGIGPKKLGFFEAEEGVPEKNYEKIKGEKQ